MSEPNEPTAAERPKPQLPNPYQGSHDRQAPAQADVPLAGDYRNDPFASEYPPPIPPAYAPPPPVQLPPAPPPPVPPPYGQVGYPHFTYPPRAYPPYGERPVDFGPDPARRRIALVVVALLVVAGGVTWGVIASRGSNSNTETPVATAPVTMPSTIGAYHQVSGATYDRLRATLQTVYGTNGVVADLFEKSKLGIYAAANSETPRLIIFAAHSSQFPQLTPQSLDGGSGGVYTAFPPGPEGGTIGCTPFNFGPITETVCVWSDNHTIGFATAVETSLSETQVAALVDRVRDSIDH